MAGTIPGADAEDWGDLEPLRPLVADVHRVLPDWRRVAAIIRAYRDRGVAAALAALPGLTFEEAGEFAAYVERRRDELDAAQQAESAGALCGVVCGCGPNGEPLACGYAAGHSGEHSWSTIPTFRAAVAGVSGGCPCLHTEPCHPNCTCAKPHMSTGCARCCSYGSPEQQTKQAERLAEQARYYSRSGDPLMRGVYQDGDGDVAYLLDRLAAVEAERDAARSALADIVGMCEPNAGYGIPPESSIADRARAVLRPDGA